MNFAHSPTSLSSGKSARIFVANEEPVEALAIESLLRDEQYLNVRITTDVREVAPMYVRWPFSLLIVDMHSTLMDGVELLQSLARPISTGELSAVALVNAGAEVERMAALAGGALDTVSRPLNHETILPAVRLALVQNAAAVV